MHIGRYILQLGGIQCSFIGIGIHVQVAKKEVMLKKHEAEAREAATQEANEYILQKAMDIVECDGVTNLNPLLSLKRLCLLPTPKGIVLDFPCRQTPCHTLCLNFVSQAWQGHSLSQCHMNQSCISTLCPTPQSIQICYNLFWHWGMIAKCAFPHHNKMDVGWLPPCIRA